MNPEHSGLQVVPNDAHGLHVTARENGKEQSAPQYYETSSGYPAWDGALKHDKDEQGTYITTQPHGEPRSKRKKYYLVGGIISFIIIAAAVGGGVGGTLASRNSKSTTDPNTSSADQNTTSTPSSDATPTTSQQITTTTHYLNPTNTAAGGFLLDCPSSNNTIYSIQQGTTEPILFRKFCGQSLKSVTGSNGINTGGFLVNIHVPSLDECINRCVAYNIQNSSEIADGTSSPCNNVCYRNGSEGDDLPGNCFGTLTLNSSTGFELQDAPICDSAAWITQNI